MAGPRLDPGPAPPEHVSPAGDERDGRKEAEYPSADSSIHVTTYSDLSLLYRVVRLLIRPLRPRLARARKEVPGGSPQLSPPSFKHGRIVESNEQGVWLYTLHVNKEYNTKQGKSEREGRPSSSAPGTRRGTKHRVYYFSGGGFQQLPSGEHWRFLGQLARDLSTAGTEFHSQTAHHNTGAAPIDGKVEVPRELEITLVSYPLAPASPASKSLPVLRNWLQHALDQADDTGDTVTLAGDSSGGNIALSLGFWAVEHYAPGAGAKVNADQPSLPTVEGKPDSGVPFALMSLLCISPSVDMTIDNPDIPARDKLDPLLTMSLHADVGRKWTGSPTATKRQSPNRHPTSSIPASDPTVSPLQHSDAAFGALRDAGIHIHGVVGTHDVLAPDALNFMRKCDQLGVGGDWLVWDGQMHCFPLAAGGETFGLKEARVGRAWVADVLRHEARR